MLSMLLLGDSLFQAPREQCSRAVKSDAKNALELGRQKAALFFPPSPFPQIALVIFAWLVLFSRRPTF